MQPLSFFRVCLQIHSKAFRFLRIFSLLSLFGVLCSNSTAALAAFDDMPDSLLYAPAIELYQENNIIVGDTLGGEPTGKLRPNDPIKRSEFTKLFTLNHLLEQVLEGKLEGDLKDFLGVDLDTFTLRTNSLLIPYYAAKSESLKFKDVPDKDIHCAMDAGGCEPWYTQYINYASALRIVQGYNDGTFRPDEPILRIHALKLVMAENGSIPANEDSKFQRLSSLKRIQGRQPKCLAEAESLILSNNGGANSQDGQNLLAYALLADKLDIFGNSCQAFTEKGISLNDETAIADYLRKNLTRKEIARYFALTTQIPELQLNPATDPTVDTEYEYIAPRPATINEEKNPLIGKINLFREGFSNKPTTKDSATKNTPTPPPVIDNTIPVFPEKEIEVCNFIPLERNNTPDMIMDCVDDLKTIGKTDAEIETLLKSVGYWIYVADILYAQNPTASNASNPNQTPSINDSLQALGKVAGASDTIATAIEIAAKLKERQKDINDHLNTNLKATKDPTKTCKYGLADKVKGTDEYIHVMAWCNAHGVTEKDLAPQKIDREYKVTFIKETSYGKTATFPTFKIEKRGKTDSYHADRTRPLYILIHGWMGSPAGWVTTTTDIIEGRTPNAQILIIDWETLAAKGLTPAKVTPLFDELSQEISTALKDWGTTNTQTTFIAHSIGTILASETSSKQNTGDGFPNMVLLDPMASFSENKISYDEIAFDGFDNNGTCIVADDALLSSEKLLSTCKHQYLIEFDDPKQDQRLDASDESYDFTATTFVGEKVMLQAFKLMNNTVDLGKSIGYKILSGIGIEIFKSANKHFWVTDSYQTISWSPFIWHTLSLDGSINSTAKLDTLSGELNGIIYTKQDSPSEIKYLKVIQSNSDYSNMYTLLGNTRANKFECKEDMECYMVGGDGGDSFNVSRHHTNSMIADFRNSLNEDQLIVGRDKGEPTFGYTQNGHDHSEDGVEIEIRYGGVGGSSFLNSKQTIFIEGVSLTDVDGWIKKATNQDGKYDKDDLIKFPIYIN